MMDPRRYEMMDGRGELRVRSQESGDEIVKHRQPAGNLKI